MRKPSYIVLSAFLSALAVSASAQQQSPHYVYDGKTLQVVNEDPAKCERWQVWLYEEGVRIPRYTAGLQHSRWGLIEGNSVEDVIRQLQASQSFEGAYLKFFGSGTWGRYTFFNPLGPIAVTDRHFEDQPTALEQLYQLRWLHARVNKLIRAATPSLENNQASRLHLPSRRTLIRSETPCSGSTNFTANCLALSPNIGSSRSESFRKERWWHRQRTVCRKSPQSCQA